MGIGVGSHNILPSLKKNRLRGWSLIHRGVGNGFKESITCYDREELAFITQMAYSLLIFHGTVREDQCTEYVTQLVAEVAGRRADFEVNIADSRRLPLNYQNEGTGNAPAELTKMVVEADGYVIVSPEYNHGYPGTLKHMLDLHLKEYIHNPVGLVGVSSGPFGGTRVIEALVQVVRELGMVVTFTDVNVSRVVKEFRNGNIPNKDKWEQRIDRMLTELLWMTTVLAYGRAQVPSHYHQES
jgi:NAD(P)H-dependent FMN reductase